MAETPVGGPRRGLHQNLPRIKVAWSAPSEQFIQAGGSVGIEYKEIASTTYLTWATVPGDHTLDFISSDVKIGQGYNVRINGISYFDVATSYVTSSITVQGSSTAPAAPSGGTLSSDGVKPKFIPTTRILFFGTRASWTHSTATDFSYYEIKATATNSDAATDFSWASDGASGVIQTSENFVFLYNQTNQAGFVRVRAVNRLGVVSAWAFIGNANGFSSVGAGSVSKYDDNDVTTTGIKTGGQSSTRQINVRYEVSEVKTLTGGAPTETITIDTTNRGFSVKPDAGVIQCASDSNIVGVYDFDAVGNSGTTSFFNLRTVDAANLPSGNQRFSIGLIDYT